MQTRTSAELRELFLQFFAHPSRRHAVVPSDVLVPANDPSVLFTPAGMNQFKPYFLGQRKDLTRAASCQKCLRTGDLERVGKTAYHHTFFEMLGNFSFGDYFKREAIGWGWEFLTGATDFAGTKRSATPALCLDLPPDRLWVSVYEQDEEAAQLWREVGVPAQRIVRLGQADNFWPANAPSEGPNGPCGPCSEIYYDPDGRAQGPRSVEVWNLVFTQFDRQSDGALKPLPRPNIDTGMGLERLACVIQGAASDYETDLFAPLIAAIRKQSKHGAPRGGPVLEAERAVADHLRAMVFLLLEGVAPSKESCGYVLRMLIRRAYRLATQVLGMVPKDRVMLCRLAGYVEQAMAGSPYVTELAQHHGRIVRAIEQEEAQFADTLAAGGARLEELLISLRATGRKTISGDEVFKLYDTYGFPVELTSDTAQEQGLTVDLAGFQSAMAVQQERSRKGSQFAGAIFVADALHVHEALPDVPPKDRQFIGYEQLQADAVIRGLWDGRQWVNAAAAGGAVGLVLNHSPLYGEAGGQIGDAGLVNGPKGWAQVDDTRWVDDVLIHQARVQEGALRVGETVRAMVDPERRLQIARSHTATHLLHWALRSVLGPEAAQAGSYVEPERLRFDFHALHKLHEEQRHRVETLVAERIRLADAVQANQMPLDEARRAGAIALFGEKYGGVVRVVTIGDYSKELCGGTHLTHTGLVGPFAIVSDSSIAAGTRRIEALVGGAVGRHQAQAAQLQEQAVRRQEQAEQHKRADEARRAGQLQQAEREAQALVAHAQRIGQAALVTAALEDRDRESLALLADAVKRGLSGDGIICLASARPGLVHIVVAATDTAAKRLSAGAVLKTVAPLIQGSGGGRPHFAQGGGKDPAGLPKVFEQIKTIMTQTLGA